MKSILIWTLLLIIPTLALSQTYNCACIGWTADQKYYDCRDIHNKKTDYKRGTHFAKLSYKQVENWIKKDRLAKYIHRGKVYEPTTGWYCQKTQ